MAGLTVLKARSLRWVWAAAALLLVVLAVARKGPEWRRSMALASVERQGDLYFQQGDIERSEACWREVLRERAESPSARNKLAVLCMKEGRFTEARRLLEEGIRTFSAQTVSFHFNLALLQYMEGDFHGALASLAEVERIHPGHGDVYFLKGVIYEQLGLDELAQEAFIEQLNVDPATPAAWSRVLDLSPDHADAGSGKVFGISQ